MRRDKDNFFSVQIQITRYTLRKTQIEFRRITFFPFAEIFINKNAFSSDLSKIPLFQYYYTQVFFFIIYIY